MLQLSPQQRGLFDSCEPRFDRRLARLCHMPLDQGAWVDHVPGWLEGHEALLETLWSTTRWQSQRRRMYERVVDVPRLVATLPADGPGHPVLPEVADALSARYGRPLPDVSLAAYRDGRDSVAFHGDRLGIDRADAIVAIVSLGAPRRFSCGEPAAARPARSISAGEICWSWAARASSPGNTPCRRWRTPACGSAFSSAPALPTATHSALSVFAPHGLPVLPGADQRPRSDVSRHASGTGRGRDRAPQPGPRPGVGLPDRDAAGRRRAAGQRLLRP